MVSWLAAVGHALTAAPSVDAALDRVLRQVLAATDVEVAECFLREPQSGYTVLAALQGPEQAAFREISAFRPGEGYPGLLIARGEPLLTFDVQHDRRYLRAAVKAAGFRTYLCVPLLGSGQVLGSLHVASRRQDEWFAEYLPFLTAVAGPLALAVARDQAQITERLGALLAGGAGAEPVPPRGTAARVLSYAVATAAADGGLLLRRGPTTGALEVAAMAGPHASLWRRGRSPLADAGCPILTGDSPGRSLHCWGAAASPDDRCARDGLCRSIHSRLKAGACVPLRQDGQLVGVLSVGWRRLPSLPTRTLAWLGALAPRAAQAVRGAPATGAPDAEHVMSAMPVATPQTAARSPATSHPDAACLRAAELTAPLAIRCLGTCSLRRDGVPVGDEVWGRPKFRRLFAYLLTRRQQWVHREVLAETFWPDLPLSAAWHNLRVALAALRRVLEPDLPPAAAGRYLQRRAELLRLCLPDSTWLDVVAFEQLSQPALQARSLDEHALERLAAAVALYEGDYLPDDLYESWAIDERQRLLDIYLTVLERLASAWSARGQFDDAVRYRRLLLARDPINEAAHRGLMADLAAAGRPAEALRQYDLCRELLRRELDVDPLPETTALYRRILAR